MSEHKTWEEVATEHWYPAGTRFMTIEFPPEVTQEQHDDIVAAVIETVSAKEQIIENRTWDLVISGGGHHPANLADKDGENALAEWLEEVFNTDKEMATWDEMAAELFERGAVRQVPTERELAKAIDLNYDEDKYWPVYDSAGRIVTSNAAKAVLKLLRGEQ